jgi:transcription elongation factor GreA
MSNEPTTTWLTQAAYDRLQAELEELSGPARTEITQRIEAAREEGDLKENSGYHAAKDEQGKMEARIRQLTALLRDATVGEAPAGDGTAGAGSVITATIAGDETVFLLGSREIAGDSDLAVYSEQSPVGQAVSGLKAGEKTSYVAPNGKEIAVEVLKVEAYEG